MSVDLQPAVCLATVDPSPLNTRMSSGTVYELFSFPFFFSLLKKLVCLPNGGG